jgi:hypothetical protein
MVQLYVWLIVYGSTSFNTCLDSEHVAVTKNLDGDEDCFDKGFSQLPYVRPFCL